MTWTDPVKNLRVTRCLSSCKGQAAKDSTMASREIRGPRIPKEIVSGLTLWSAEEELQKEIYMKWDPLDETGPDKRNLSQGQSAEEKPERSTIRSRTETTSETDYESNDTASNPSSNNEALTVSVDENYVKIVYGKTIAPICAFFNAMLAHSTLASGYLPLEPTNILDRLSDGVLLCAMANALQPGTVDEAAVSRGSVLNLPCGSIHKRKNVNLGVTSLQVLGLYIGLFYKDRYPPNDKTALPKLPPGILLQVMRLSALRPMNLKDNERLVYMFDSWQTEQEIAAIMALSREEMLRHWVNYQLKKAGTGLQLNDFTGLADSLVYGCLLDTVAPADKKASLVSMETIQRENDLMERAAMVLKNAQTLGIDCIITPEHISGAQGLIEPSASVSAQIIYVMNIVFLAQIYFTCPSIDVPKQALNLGISESLRSSYPSGSTEEMLVMWLNSIGVSSPVVSLDTDLRTGLTLLQVCETMSPGRVNWSRVTLNFSGMDISKYSACCLSNCSEVMTCVKSLGINVVKCSTEDIAHGDTAGTKDLLLKLMQLQVLSNSIIFTHEVINEVGYKKKNFRWKSGKTPWQCCESGLKYIESWFRRDMKWYKSGFRVKSLDDQILKSTNVLGFIGERKLFRIQCSCCASSITEPEETSSTQAAEAAATAGTRTDSCSLAKRFRTGFMGAVRTLAAALAEVPRKLKQGMSKSSEREADFNRSDPSDDDESSEMRTWRYSNVHALLGDEQEQYSQTAITMLRQGFVSVFTSRLGPNNDAAIAKSVLVQILDLHI